MPTIRPAVPDDLDAVIALLSTFPDDPELRDIDWEDGRRVYAELLGGEKGHITVAEEGGAIVGIVTLGFSTAMRFGGPYAMIEEFLVAESQRGKGLARPLLAAARAEAERRQCRELQVNGPSPEGTPVYLRNGFHESGAHLKIWL